MSYPRRLAAIALTGTLAACASDAPPPPIEEVAGNCADVYGGQVCTWAHMQGDQLVDMGATIPLTSIENTPMEVPMAWPPAANAVLEMPAAAQAAGGFKFMTMGWEPVGHTPATFLVPHFDFHFYVTSDADRIAIDCADESKPAALPVGYVLPDETLPDEVADMIGVKVLVGVCVPEMGMHGITEAETTATTPFRNSMIIGYYHANPIFIEPMITQAMLRERKSFDMTVPTIPGLEGQPTAFHAEYDPAADAYRFVFSGTSMAH